ncbi:MAG: PhoX family phosphatase [Chloroflexi bacterium]|nr:MAG: PhoX family phosphatase [Chloroflexota bacterium]
MTTTPERPDAQPLQFVEDRNALIPNKCIWKCAGACYHEAPNERSGRDSMADIINRRFSRRQMIKGAVAATVPLVIAGTPVGSALFGSSAGPKRAEAFVAGRSLGFFGIPLHTADSVQVASGYTSNVLLRWGDPLFPNTPRMTIDNATAELQAKTFGYNCDLNVFFALEGSTGGLMAINHEYTEGARMFRTYTGATATKAQVDLELAAHGMTIVELARTGNAWSANINSRYNRRITGTTPMELTGPLRGDALVKTSADPLGTTVLGTLNNCAGGRTPWGTVLTAEENFNQYFGNNDNLPDSNPQKAVNKRYGVTPKTTERQWERLIDRFDAAKEPNEVNRFGFLVEIDPYDPTFVPKKRSALGRFKHEAASVGIARSGQVVVYSGDDERFDYLYKFVSKGIYNPAASAKAANMALLDEGTLYVARLSDDGTGTWIPLEAGKGALATWTQAQILTNTRGAGDAVKATPMDRPEDVEINPANNRVYMVCTNNTNRTVAQIDGPNPRPSNAAGHIIEMDEWNGDLGSTRFTWSIFMICGDPTDGNTYFAGFSKADVSAIGAPDNIAFDALGNMWIATDGQFNPIKKNDSIFAVPVAGPDRGKLQAFMNCPSGAEVCGPEFSTDYQALFANIQHPGEGGKGPNEPQSVWPDGTWPALPSLIVITKNGGGRIGS